MLKVAFKRRLLFTIGRSVTTGKDNRIIWNGVHFKTNVYGGNMIFNFWKLLGKGECQFKKSYSNKNIWTLSGNWMSFLFVLWRFCKLRIPRPHLPSTSHSRAIVQRNLSCFLNRTQELMILLCLKMRIFSIHHFFLLPIYISLCLFLRLEGYFKCKNIKANRSFWKILFFIKS